MQKIFQILLACVVLHANHLPAILPDLANDEPDVSLIAKVVQDAPLNQPCIEKILLTEKEMKCHLDPYVEFFSTLDPGHPKTFLFIKNFPKDEKIIFSIRRLAQKTRCYEKNKEFFINKDGKIQFEEGEAPNSFFCVSSKGYLPGERISCRFATANGNFKEKVSFIPNPIIAKNTSGLAVIEAELIDYISGTYKMNFSGFQENEKIKFISISGKEQVKNFYKLSPNLLITYSPAIIGQEGGVAKLTFNRELIGEQIQMEIPWGNELLNYMLGNTIYKTNGSKL